VYYWDASSLTPLYDSIADENNNHWIKVKYVQKSYTLWV